MQWWCKDGKTYRDAQTTRNTEYMERTEHTDDSDNNFLNKEKEVTNHKPKKIF